MSGIPFGTIGELKDKLTSSLSHYGKVCRIQTIYEDNIFEGAAIVLLDTSEDPTTTSSNDQPLSNWFHTKKVDLG